MFNETLRNYYCYHVKGVVVSCKMKNC